MALYVSALPTRLSAPTKCITFKSDFPQHWIDWLTDWLRDRQTDSTSCHSDSTSCAVWPIQMTIYLYILPNPPTQNVHRTTQHSTVIFPATEPSWHKPHLKYLSLLDQFHSLIMVLRTATRQQRSPPLIFVLQFVSRVHIITGSLLFTSPSVHNACASPHEDHCERSPLFAEYNMTPPTVW